MRTLMRRPRMSRHVRRLPDYVGVLTRQILIYATLSKSATIDDDEAPIDNIRVAIDSIYRICPKGADQRYTGRLALTDNTHTHVSHDFYSCPFIFFCLTCYVPQAFCLVKLILARKRAIYSRCLLTVYLAAAFLFVTRSCIFVFTTAFYRL